MKDLILRNLGLVAGCVLTGFVGSRAASVAVGASGEPAVGILQTDVPVAAVVTILIAMALMTVVAIAIGRLVNAVVGLFVLGAGLLVLARRMGDARDLAFGPASVGLAIVETALWTFVLLGAAWSVFRMAGPLPDVEPHPDGTRPHPLFSRDALVQMAAGLVMIPALWVVAQSPMKGQTLAAACIGGIAAGMVGRWLAPHVQPLALFAAPCLAGAIAQGIGLAMLSGPFEQAMVAGAAPSLMMAMPVDIAAGTLIGVAFGLGWAKSFLEHEDVPATQTRSA